MRAYLGLAGIVLLSGCGVPSNPEKGPVILLCEGEKVGHYADGTSSREKMHDYYRLDGVKHTFERWKEDDQSWSGTPDRIKVSPNEIVLQGEPQMLAGITSTTTVTFDRTSGRVTDEFLMSNGSVATFSGSCKPVKDTTSQQKF